nr:MAG TPA: hypothetical protein [Caudoviricetes sp.]DAY27421.1 MAG TPA: hypothetical protein [Caudoviricetes sp.]
MSLKIRLTTYILMLRFKVKIRELISGNKL